MNGPRWLGPFSSCCSIWLAESALLSPLPRPAATANRRAGNTCELNATRWLTAWQCGHSRPYAHAIWLKWRCYDPFVTATVLAGCSDQVHDFLTAAYDHMRSHAITCASAKNDDERTMHPLWPLITQHSGGQTSWVLIRGCVLYVGLQIFTLWQKSKVGVRIIFDGILYSKFYGTWLHSLCIWWWNLQRDPCVGRECSAD